MKGEKMDVNELLLGIEEILQISLNEQSNIDKKNKLFNFLIEAKNGWCRQQREICAKKYTVDYAQFYKEREEYKKILNAPEPELE